MVCLIKKQTVSCSVACIIKYKTESKQVLSDQLCLLDFFIENKVVLLFFCWGFGCHRNGLVERL